MTRDEAYEILGLPKGASAEEIIHAHRVLMKKFIQILAARPLWPRGSIRPRKFCWTDMVDVELRLNTQRYKEARSAFTPSAWRSRENRYAQGLAGLLGALGVETGKARAVERVAILDELFGERPRRREAARAGGAGAGEQLVGFGRIVAGADLDDPAVGGRSRRFGVLSRDARLFFAFVLPRPRGFRLGRNAFGAFAQPSAAGSSGGLPRRGAAATASAGSVLRRRQDFGRVAGAASLRRRSRRLRHCPDRCRRRRRDSCASRDGRRRGRIDGRARAATRRAPAIHRRRSSAQCGRRSRPRRCAPRSGLP